MEVTRHFVVAQANEGAKDVNVGITWTNFDKYMGGTTGTGVQIFARNEWSFAHSASSHLSYCLLAHPLHCHNF